MWGIFFGEFQCLPVDDCPAASCDSGVLARGSESTTFYSAILVPLYSSIFKKWKEKNLTLPYIIITLPYLNHQTERKDMDSDSFLIFLRFSVVIFKQANVTYTQFRTYQPYSDKTTHYLLLLFTLDHIAKSTQADIMKEEKGIGKFEWTVWFKFNESMAYVLNLDSL